jgi:signal transduction histidine kinase
MGQKGKPGLFLKGIFLPTLFLIAGHIFASGQAHPPGFRKIPSGTRANIHQVVQGFDHALFFLTDQIFRLEGDSWKKIELPVEGKIQSFFPISRDEFWYGMDQDNNTTTLYHRKGALTTIVSTPFVNHISCIQFIDAETGFFASAAEVTLYQKGAFTPLTPCPTRSGIIKILPLSEKEYYARTHEGELYHFRNGKYFLIVQNRSSSDICLDPYGNAVVFVRGMVGRFNGQSLRWLARSPVLDAAKGIIAPDSNKILLVGGKGHAWQIEANGITNVSLPSKENLLGIKQINTDEFWIFGEKGRLLYKGARIFPDYIEENTGFATAKLIVYGVNTEDEYGVAMRDFTGDGKPDIYTVRIFEQNRFYINYTQDDNLETPLRGFFDEAVRRNALGALNPLNRSIYGELKLGIAASDIDNDGDQDIYLCYLNSNNKLLLNNSDGFFRNVSGQPNRSCLDLHRSNSSAFADVDLDGDVDLFVANEEGSNRIFENDGTGSFRDVTAASGLSSDGGGMCASFSDFDADGLPDLCVTFWYPGNKLYKNISSGGLIRFRDITARTDLSLAPPARSNGVAFADVNNDGAPDLFIANRNTGNRLYINHGKGIFRDSTSRWFHNSPMMSNGVALADFDLDGYLDLYLSNVGENVFYRNITGKRFADVTASFGANLGGYCTGSATGDVDNDGDPDLYVANYINGNSQLFLNITERKTFIKIRVHGIRSARDGTGAKIWLFRETNAEMERLLCGFREVTSGSGYGSVSSEEQIFGAKDCESYRVLVKFPCSPDTLRFTGLRSGTTLEVYELTGIRAYFTLAVKSMVRFFIDPENQPEIGKFLLIFFILAGYNLLSRDNLRKIKLIRLTGSLIVFLLFSTVNYLFLFSGFTIFYFIAPAVALTMLGMLHLIIGRVLLRRHVRKEKLELREKLSRDLHDDLASTLGSISIYANTLSSMNDPSPDVFKRLTGKVASLNQSALQSISDIIWMTSPRNDSLQSLVAKAGNQMFELLTDNQIGFENLVDIPEEPIILQENVRNDAFLILKEALHNTIRHARATHVVFSAKVDQKECCLILSDNGTGIPSSVLENRVTGIRGNGLENMRRRAGDSDIRLSVISDANKGTKIILKFRI